MFIKIHRPINILLICLFILLTATACGGVTPVPTATPIPTVTSSAQPSLAGTWKGQYNGAEVIMTFEPNGMVGLVVYGNLHGGTYTVNYETAPYQLDYVLQDNGTVQTILEFLDANTIKIENVYPGEARPVEFKDYFLLTR